MQTRWHKMKPAGIPFIAIVHCNAADAMKTKSENIQRPKCAVTVGSTTLNAYKLCPQNVCTPAAHSKVNQQRTRCAYIQEYVHGYIPFNVRCVLRPLSNDFILAQRLQILRPSAQNNLICV